MSVCLFVCCLQFQKNPFAGFIIPESSVCLFFLSSSSSSSSSVREKKSFTTTTKNCGFCGFWEEVCVVVHLRHKQILKPPRACEELAAKMGKSKASLSLCLCVSVCVSVCVLVYSYESKQAQEEHADADDENHDVPCFFFCVLD